LVFLIHTELRCTVNHTSDLKEPVAKGEQCVCLCAFMARYRVNTKLVFLGEFAKLRRATISFAMSVHSSFRPHETTRPPLDGFSWNLILELFFFENLSRKFKLQ